MKLIIHIGTAKTGTTSIQLFLYQNQDLLRENGYHFLQNVGKKNNRELAAYCMNDYKNYNFFRTGNISTKEDKEIFKKNLVKKLKEEILSLPESVHTVIVTSEHFHSRTKTEEEVKNLYILMAPYFTDIKIVCYIREQIKMCTSLYSTAIKSGNNPLFADFLKKCTPDNIYYNYSDMLLNWEKVFGRKAIDVSLFEKKEFLNHDLLDDFIAKINPELISILDKNISVENESLTYPGQILGKAINQIYPKKTKFDKSIERSRRRCQKIIYQKCKGTGEQASLEEQKRIYNSFTESNEALRKKYFPNKEILFQPPYIEPEIDKTINDNFIDILVDVLTIAKEDNRKIAIPVRYASVLQDAATRLEEESPEVSLKLMSLAHKIRPTDHTIKQKLKEYRRLSH